VLLSGGDPAPGAGDADGGADGFGVVLPPGAGVVDGGPGASAAAICAETWAVGVSTLLPAIVEPPPRPGRERLISRQSPPGDPDGADEAEADTRNDPEFGLHGCQRRGVEPARDPGEPVSAVDGAGADTIGGAAAGAAVEVPAGDLKPPPVPATPLPAAGGATLSSGVGVSHSGHTVTGFHVFHRTAATAAAAVTTRTMTSRTRFRLSTSIPRRA
jgi:hypothetical protein